MGFFDRFRKKKRSETDDLERLSAIASDPDRWDGLDEEELFNLIMVKSIEYGVSQDASLIPPLFGFYRYGMTRLSVDHRRAMVTQYAEMTEGRDGGGHMGLMVFMAADTDASVRSSAALSLSVLYPPDGDDELSGPEFVVRSILREQDGGEVQGAALGGVLLLGDRRLLPMLEDAWAQLSEEARLGLTQAKSGFASEAFVEFWLRCLEKGCSDSVYGSIVAALAKLPAVSQMPAVVDMERAFPAYSDPENPMLLLAQTSFPDYLEKIRPRLEALERSESEPKLIPKLIEVWENPESFENMFS